MPTFTTDGATIQTFTVATTGEYQVSLAGAQGGDGDNAGVLETGGLGAAVGGDVFLTSGEKLEIVVGGEGGNDHIGSGSLPGGGGGGGGGSFLIEEGTSGYTLLAAAGGGGGGGYNGTGLNAHTGAGGGNGAGASASASLGQGGAGGVGSADGGGGGEWGGGGGGFTGGAGSTSNVDAASGSGLSTSLTTDHFSGGAGGAGAGGQTGIGTGGAGGFGGGGGGGLSGGGGGGGYGGGGGGGGGGAGNTEAYGVGGGGGGSYVGGLTNTAAFNGVHSGAGVVTLTLICFVSGTGIRTTSGEVAVEDLEVGDLAVTAAGEARPIAWLGHRRIARPSREQWPVRVTAGAFGENQPARDLFLSPGHAVCVDVMGEVFVPIDHLINDATIARVEVPEVTYWHVELESHDILLAEGLPAESYMDCGNRSWFGRDYGRLAEVDPERVAESLTRYARPFVDRGPIVAAIRERLAARAAALGAAASPRRAA